MSLRNWRPVMNDKTEFQKAVDAFTKQQNEELQRLMYVYFDEPGNIKCIAPAEDADHHEKFLCTKKPVVEVYKFITGELAPNKFKVKKIDGKVNEYEIVKRNNTVSYIRSMDRFLTEISLGYERNYELEIIADKDSKTLTFKLVEGLRKELLESVDDINLAGIHGMRVLKFYCTTKNDPSILVESYEVPVGKLLTGEVHVDFTVDIEKFSIFTRRVLNNYGYKIIGE